MYLVELLNSLHLIVSSIAPIWEKHKYFPTGPASPNLVQIPSLSAIRFLWLYLF